MQMNFKSMECKYKDRKGKWIVTKIRKRDRSVNIRNEVVRHVINPLDEKKGRRGADKKTRSIVRAARTPPHRVIFRCNVLTGLSVPSIEPLASLGWAGHLVICAIRGRRLYNTALTGTQAVFLSFKVERKAKASQTPICEEGGQCPLWNHTLSIPVSSEDRVISVTVYAKGHVQKSVVGRFQMSIPLLISYLNPIAASFSGKTTADVIARRDAAARSTLMRRVASIVPSLHGKTTYTKHRQQIRECSQNNFRSWFSLGRDFNSPQFAGEVLLDIRFFANPMSKVVDWTLGPELLRPISRSGKVFGVPIRDAIDQSECECPQPVVDCIEYLLEFGLLEEGLFRVPGDSRKLQMYRSLYDKHENVVISGIHEAASVLKLYFRELPEPIIPKRMYQAFLDVEREDVELGEKIEKYRYLLSMLPRENSMLLHYLMYFLRCVADLSATNMMEEKNIGIVWAPNLLRSPIPNDPKDVFNIPKTIGCVRNLVGNFEQLFHASMVSGSKNRASGSTDIDAFTAKSITTKASSTDSSPSQSHADAKLARQQRKIDHLTSELKIMTDRAREWEEQRKRMESQLETFRRARDRRISMQRRSSASSVASKITISQDLIKSLAKPIKLKSTPKPAARPVVDERTAVLMQLRKTVSRSHAAKSTDSHQLTAPPEVNLGKPRSSSLVPSCGSPKTERNLFVVGRASSQVATRGSDRSSAVPSSKATVGSVENDSKSIGSGSGRQS